MTRQELEEGQIVLCTVEKILGTTVFVKIEGNGEGTITTSEISPGRIRNLRDYVVPGKKIVCKILSIKEDRIRKITHLYYSKPEIQKIIYEFAKNREISPRYFEGFGKRPDSFQYISDVYEMVKKGATSFHCSEEIWEDPLKIVTGMNSKQLDEIREGWDLLIDIDLSVK